MRLNLSPLFSRRLVLGYDIWCQYGVHLLERFRRNPHLSWPEYLEELTGVVGAWHIFAHVRECFGRFSGMYVWGIGIIEMEILETLWSLINMMTEATRSMSRANREETINFYINDMNLKKNQNLSESIDQYRAALPGDRGESPGPPDAPGVLRDDVALTVPQSPPPSGSGRSRSLFAPAVKPCSRPWTLLALFAVASRGRHNSRKCIGSVR